MELLLWPKHKNMATDSFGWRVDSGDMIWSEEAFRIFECNRAMKPLGNGAATNSSGGTVAYERQKHCKSALHALL